MKIIFLDIDGVLVTFDSMRRSKSHPHLFAEKAITNLNLLINRTDAKVVLSSTWRIMFNLKDFNHLINERGLNFSIIDSTPSDAEFGRGHEINLWLQAARERGLVIDGFVIIDDDTDMNPFSDKLVKTSMRDGFTSDNLCDALRILDSKLGCSISSR